MSVSNISQLERGTQGYSQPGVHALADALDCDPSALLGVNPFEGEDIWSVWKKATPSQRRRIIEIAKTIIRPDD